MPQNMTKSQSAPVQALAATSTPTNPVPTHGTNGVTSSMKFANPLILDKIDKLFACNVGHHIDLPQLVVVGDQSSGKSSVLQGLTNLPFPRDSGLCTRFVTQITFRRSPEKRMSVRIIPSKDASAEHAEKTRAWSKLDIVNLDEEIFSEIMTEVHTVMGIRSKDGIAGRTFSDDKLHLEISGPDQQHLSVVDVPGIFKKTTPGVTTKDDMKMVEHMVESYVKNSRSVILAVIPANVDPATQCILEMAEEHDPTGQRTLGVLTKPDLVDQGAEKNIMDLLEGRAHKLALGWCVVRNLGQKDAENGEDRHAVENSFFKTTTPWNKLDKDRVGVEALQIRLTDILTGLTRREFPAVRMELNKLLKSMKNSLEALGPSRGEPEQQAHYLTSIASRFQELASNALQANYFDEIFDKDQALRLATQVVTRRETFNHEFNTLGHTYSFDADAVDEDSASFRGSSQTERAFLNAFKKANEARIQASQRSLAATRTEVSHPDISDILHENVDLELPELSGIDDWLSNVYKASRGFELGTFESALLSATMKVQSTKWVPIVQGYISDVVVVVHHFITKLFKELCPDERVRSAIMSMLLDGLVSQYKRAFDQAEFVLHIERMEAPGTTNHYFNENLEKSRQARLQKKLSDCSFRADDEEVVRMKDIVAANPMSNSEHTTLNMRDILAAYYKVARKRIVDVVHMQAVGHHLLSSKDGPLRIFSPSFVALLTAEQLEEIAGEDEHVKRKRVELKKGIENLEKGKAILC